MPFNSGMISREDAFDGIVLSVREFERHEQRVERILMTKLMLPCSGVHPVRKPDVICTHAERYSKHHESRNGKRGTSPHTQGWPPR